jgi:hypothetical protein
VKREVFLNPSLKIESRKIVEKKKWSGTLLKNLSYQQPNPFHFCVEKPRSPSDKIAGRKKQEISGHNGDNIKGDYILV